MLNIIGIGLNDPKDITVKGLEYVRESDAIYLEQYTSLLQCSVDELEDFYGKEVTAADRELVEQKGEILKRAEKEDISLLIIGDVFSATTHFEIYKEALERDIETRIVHNASVLTAVSQTGMQLYKFGRTPSIPLLNKDVTGPYDMMVHNLEFGLHTLFLLDIKQKEGEYMTIKQGIEYLLRVSRETSGLFDEDTVCIGCARLGSDDPVIKTATAKELMGHEFGGPPHCIIVPGELHFLEEEALELWK